MTPTTLEVKSIIAALFIVALGCKYYPHWLGGVITLFLVVLSVGALLALFDSKYRTKSNITDTLIFAASTGILTYLLWGF